MHSKNTARETMHKSEMPGMCSNHTVNYIPHIFGTLPTSSFTVFRLFQCVVNNNKMNLLFLIPESHESMESYEISK